MAAEFLKRTFWPTLACDIFRTFLYSFLSVWLALSLVSGGICRSAQAAPKAKKLGCHIHFRSSSQHVPCPTPTAESLALTRDQRTIPVPISKHNTALFFSSLKSRAPQICRTLSEVWRASLISQMTGVFANSAGAFHREEFDAARDIKLAPHDRGCGCFDDTTPAKKCLEWCIVAPPTYCRELILKLEAAVLGHEMKSSKQKGNSEVQ